MTFSMFLASVFLMLLPQMVGLCRAWSGDGADRSGTALSVGACGLVMSMGWVLNAARVSAMVPGVLVVLPVMLYVIYSHGHPWLALQRTLESRIYQRFIAIGWFVAACTAMVTIASMYYVWWYVLEHP